MITFMGFCGVLLAMGIGEGIGTLLAHLVEETHRSRFRKEWEEENKVTRIVLKTRGGHDLCMVCEDKIVSTKFLPCESELMCSQCARNLLEIGMQTNSSPKCPQCHDVVEKVEYN